MKFFNIEFAPLCIPLERRLQTLAVTMLMVVHLGNVYIATGLTYFFIFHTRLWWLCSLYLIWIFFIDTDFDKSSRSSEWVKNWSWWKYAQAYYPIRIKIMSKELDQKRNYLFCGFPHGLLSTGVAITFITNALNIKKYYPHHTIHGHTLKFIFYLPFMREFGVWLGALPSSKESLNYTMGKPEGGNISVLVIGGAEESFYCNPGMHKIILRKRKGFIKLALKTGCSLVPVYSFGENETYGQFYFDEGSIMRKIQVYFKKLTGIALIYLKGRGIFQYTFGILPHRRPINIVVGEPIDVQKTENPTQEEIDHLHQLFQDKLVELFNSQKKYYLEDHETAQLEIC